MKELELRRIINKEGFDIDCRQSFHQVPHISAFETVFEKVTSVCVTWEYKKKKIIQSLYLHQLHRPIAKNFHA